MLEWITKTTSGLVRDIYEVADSSASYIVEEVASIPDAISEGWNEGFFSTPEKPIENSDTQSEGTDSQVSQTTNSTTDTKTDS